MKAVSTLFLLLMTTNLVCGQEQEKKDKKEPAKPSTQSRIETRTYFFKEADKDMEYALFVPSTYDKEKKTPLIVALHGLLSTPHMMLRYPRLTDEAEKYGYHRGGADGLQHHRLVRQQGTQGQDQTGESRRIERKGRHERAGADAGQLQHRQGSHLSDGTFDGGRRHLASGTEAPRRLGGPAPISPAIFRAPEGLAKIKHIPVLVIQGDKDNLVPVAGVRAWVKAMKELGMTHEYLEVARRRPPRRGFSETCRGSSSFSTSTQNSVWHWASGLGFGIRH